MLDIKYICPKINQGECAEKTKLAYTDKLSKEIANKLRTNYEYFYRFDKIIVYYDYGQVEAIAQKKVLTKSELEFFHSKNAFTKNIYKNIAKKKI